MRRPLLFALAGLCACGNDITVSKGSACNGEADGDEASVDAPFDADHDGYYDGANPDCVATYDAAHLDCNDQNADVHPGAQEVGCDDVDNDCDAATPDADDVDADGFDACDDCDDLDGLVNPGATELGCNGVDDDCDATTLDAPDLDEDGIDACSDCHDGDADVSPVAVEVTCNGVDDDCDDATLDQPDNDGDGVVACGDCNDADASISPDDPEVCSDGRDNDCDGETDEDCDVDYSGLWTLDTSVEYRCAGGALSINFGQVNIYEVYPSIEVTSSGTGRSPGTMTGSFSSEVRARATRTITGTCQEDYIFDVEFTSADTFEAVFQAEFTEAYANACRDCKNQTWVLTGSR